MMTTISLTDLAARYGLSSKQVMHKRISKLKERMPEIVPEVDGKYSTKHLPLFDRLDEFIKGGGTTAMFPLEVLDIQTIQVSEIKSNLPLPSQISIEDAVRLVHAIASLVTSQPTGLNSFEWLDKAAKNNWKLSTSQVRELIGVKPRVSHDSISFIWGSFYFMQAGKMGRQLAWCVRRTNPSPLLSIVPDDAA